jgi:hypothetical protein
MQDFDSPPKTPFAEMLELVRVTDPVAFFQYRADRTTIANWKAGRAPAPQWAIERLRQHWNDLTTHGIRTLQSIRIGPGRKAGTKNIMAYNARR